MQQEIPEQYRPCKDFADLYVDKEGNFVYRGKPKAVMRSVGRHDKKLTARINIVCNIHNISADNLRIVTKKDYSN